MEYLRDVLNLSALKKPQLQIVQHKDACATASCKSIFTFILVLLFCEAIDIF